MVQKKVYVYENVDSTHRILKNDGRAEEVWGELSQYGVEAY